MLAASSAIRKGIEATSGGPVELTDPERDSTGRDREASAVSPAGSVALTRMTCAPGDKSSVTFVAVPRGVDGPPSTLTAYSTTTESVSRFGHEIETGVVVTFARGDTKTNVGFDFSTSSSATRTVSILPAPSTEENSRTCLPSSDRLNGPVYGIQMPPSRRYCVDRTPLKPSVGLSVTDTFETYQPWSPSTPVNEAVVDGGVVSTETIADRTVSCRPARSVAKNSRKCRPSPSPNGPLYVCHDPLSTRYVMLATPLVASVAASEIVTLEMYQPSSPTVPVGVIVDWGGIVSVEMFLRAAGSAFPA